MELILLSIAVLLLGILYMKHIKKYSYWRERNIKSLTVYPIVGSYPGLSIGKTHMGKQMRNIYEKYPNDEYIGGFKGSTPELIVRDPEIIRCILSKDFNHFMYRGIIHNVRKGDVLGQHLFHLGGEKWKALRQKLTPTFTPSKMRKMFHLVVECGVSLEASIKEKLLDSKEIEIKELFAKYTIDTIGSCAFGLDMNSLKDDNSYFREIGKKLFNPPEKRGPLTLLWSAVFKFVHWSDVMTNAHEHHNKIQDFFIGLVKGLIKTRTGSKKRHDFIDSLLEMREKGSSEMKNANDTSNNKLELTDELITAQLFVFLIAGFETSSTTMSYALRELALNPDVQKKLQLEIDTVLKNHDGLLSYDCIQEMDYLNMVIDETLRKYPPAPFLNRLCTTSYKLPNTDVTIDKGVLILIPVYGLHHDPLYFPDPEKFQPERFSKETGNTHPQFAYMPFGEGPRSCIGLRFAKLQTAVGLTTILRNYSVEACSKTPIMLDLVPSAFVLTSVGGFTVRFTPRD